ncbi:nucleotidyltransferase domain-containing protein [Thermodesulfovibrionales bacterium]|nr:nucleotidyltransferase domain-containing protein [Thermodesulfovibrionales bacterium]
MVTEVEDKHGLLGDSGLDFMPKGGNMQEIAGWVADNFNSVKRILTDDRTGFASKYSNLSICRCIIGSANFSTWKEALNEAGTIFKKFRDKNKGRFFDSGAFGLPIIHRSSHTAVKERIENSAINRRSSPLVFKIIRVNDQYFWMVLRLAGEFLPEGGVISANRESSKPDYGIIDEFWAEIKEKGKEYMFSMPQMLKDMTEKIKNEVDPKKIILFGSKARGDFHRRSDTDIAIDAEKPLANLSLLGAADIVNFREADKKTERKNRKRRSGDL